MMKFNRNLSARNTDQHTEYNIITKEFQVDFTHYDPQRTYYYSFCCVLAVPTYVRGTWFASYCKRQHKQASRLILHSTK